MFECLTSILVFCSAIHQILGVCPKSVEPCVCGDFFGYSQVFCGETENIDLENIFENLSQNFTNSEKYFKLFLLNKTAINELKNTPIFETLESDICYELTRTVKNDVLDVKVSSSTYFTYKKGSTKLNYGKFQCKSGHCNCPFGYSLEKCRIQSTCISECNKPVNHCFDEEICDCVFDNYVSKVDCHPIVNCSLPDLCLNGGDCHEEEGGYYCVCPKDYEGLICEEKVRTTLTAIFVLIIIMGCLLIIGLLVFSLIFVRKVKKARATQGQYSPSTEEMFGNSASDGLKLPPVERLI